jgi:hypothetical protein
MIKQELSYPPRCRTPFFQSLHVRIQNGGLVSDPENVALILLTGESAFVIKNILVIDDWKT